MVVDFDGPDAALPERTDVCVIGAGAAGILLALELTRAGRRVVLLEGGGLRQEARSQRIYDSDVLASKGLGQPHRGIHEGRFRTYGGSTTQWGGQILELQEQDFAVRPQVPGSGWPFPKSTLTPFYERALVYEGLRRVERDDASVWAGLGLAQPDLGPAFAMAYSRWCPERNFAALHGRELAESRRLQVFTHASVVAFELNDAQSAIQSVQVKGFSGRQSALHAGTFILCMGGIESTRLLLQPLAQGIAPWQQSALLGRFYQDHISLSGLALREVRVPTPWRNFGYVALQGFRYQNKLLLRAEEQQAMHTLNVAGAIGPARSKDPARDRAEVLLRQTLREGRKPGLGEWMSTALHLPGIAADRAAARWLGESFAWRTMVLAVHCEQSPQGQSRIALGSDRDELGLLRTQLRWHIGEQELHTLRSYVRTAQEAFARTGLARLDVPPGFFTDDALLRSLCRDSNHHMGGARMAGPAGQGVVDSDLRLHGVSNGYVCSSAVFPTSGFSNPTHTLLALGMRLADHLLAQAGKVLVAKAEAGPMRTVALPGTGRAVPQLGFGCAYLLGPGLDRTRSLRLLDAAYAAGIRHFDTARLYGQGHTEALLREFLATHRDVSVTTKYGVLPPSLPRRAWDAAARRLPSLPKLPRQDKARFAAREARASLETSLRSLGRDAVELFLLHEPTVDDLRHDDLLALLLEQQQRGTIGAFGIGGEFARLPQLLQHRPAYAGVVQFEHSVLGPNFSPPLPVPHSQQIHYRSFARPAEALWNRLQHSPLIRERWSAKLNVELEELPVLRDLLLKAALDDSPQTLTLFSSSSEEHILRCVEVAGDPSLSAPAKHLSELLHQNDLGTGEALYGPYSPKTPSKPQAE